MADVHPKPSAPGPSRDDEVVERRTLRDYYIMLRERLWIALPLALLISVGYAYREMQAPAVYQSEATMQFEKPDTIVTTQGVVDQGIRSDMDLNTAIGVLQSQTLRARVFEQLTDGEKELLRRAVLKHRPPGSPPAPVNLDSGLLGSVYAYPVRGSFLIKVNVTHFDADAAAMVANKFVKEFMNYLYENAGGRNTNAIEYLNLQAERLRKESEDNDAALNAYMKENNLISLDSSQNLIGEALKASARMRDDANLRVLGLEDKVKTIDRYQKEGKNLLELGDVANYGAVPTLKSQLTALQQQQSLYSQKYLERHPTMVDLADKIAAIQADLDKAEALAIADLRAQLSQARQSLATFQTEYEKHEKESMHLNDLAVEFKTLQRKAEVSKSNYSDILHRLNDTTTTKAVEKVPLHPLDPAGVPGGPSSPNKPAITRTATGIGALVFFGVAIGLSFIDDRIKSAWDVESFIGANLLGIIPDLQAMKDEEKYNLLLDNKQVPGTEAFLSVYSAVKIHSKLDFPKSILVTSTIPGEGKTLVSCNVAGSFARHGKKTLLVDCDLRRPMLHRHFKQQNNAGLLAWFEAGSPIEGDLITHPALGIIKVGENLWLLCSGGRSKSPTELLESPLFGQLIERLKREFDLVIVDSPPLGAVTDSLLIAERIDEVIYVCRFNRAYRKHIRLYMRALRSGKNEVLGIVLNGLSPRRIEYYSNYRYYRSYKKYYGAQT
jgi:polysaccharide biosynthesis transport protein